MDRHYLDGTIEGALKAGHETYPPSYSPSDADFMNFLPLLFNYGKNPKGKS